jgi:sugar phosphate isomerase/epimerase
MKLGPRGDCHLTYCTNIHPGETWPEVRGILQRYLPEVKREIAPDKDLGVGLRLSGAAAYALQQRTNFEELRALLRANGLYVFTINGFPYGTFHGTRVKEDVYLPDWQDDERLRYSNVLAELLAALLPDDSSLEGSISTVPGAFKPRAASPEATARIAQQLLRHAAHLVRLRERTGRTIALALEPEPCCLLETIDETIEFFDHYLFAPAALRELAALTGLHNDAADEALRRHLGVCLDLCHAAVEFEDPETIVRRLEGKGIRIAKMQISAGLRVAEVTANTERLLRPFDDKVYLHQVIERAGSQLTRYTDLPQAFAGLASSKTAREWRIHFHVPIFLEDFGELSSTQSFLRTMLKQHRAQPISPHLEVETYTWGVLPEQYRREGLVPAIVRELDWVNSQLEAS